MPDIYGIEIRDAAGNVVIDPSMRLARFLAIVDSSSAGSYSSALMSDGYQPIAFPIPSGSELNTSIEITITLASGGSPGSVAWSWGGGGSVSGSKLVVGVL